MTADARDPLLPTLYEHTCRVHRCRCDRSLLASLPQSVDDLKELDLRRHYIGPANFDPILSIIGSCPNLETLVLVDQGITDIQVFSLCELLEKASKLRTIDLSGNPLSAEAGVALLAAIGKNVSLHNVKLERTLVPHVVVSRIASAVSANQKKNMSLLSESNNKESHAAVTVDAAPAPPRAVSCSLCGHVTMPCSAIASAGFSVSGLLLDTDPLDSISECLRTRDERFVDEQFPPSWPSAVGEGENVYDIRDWGRLCDMLKDSAGLPLAGPESAEFFGSAPTNEDAPEFPPCFPCSEWVFTAAAATLLSKESIAELINPPYVNPLGIYTVRLFIDCKYRYVVVDDLLPRAGDRTPVFAGSPLGSRDAQLPPHTAWACILQKAIAKLYGSFSALLISPQSSFVHRALEQLIQRISAGAVTTLYPLPEADEVWEALRAVETDRDRTRVIAVARSGAEEYGINALFSFSVKCVIEAHGFALVGVTEAYGCSNNVYSGEWCRGHSNWKTYPDTSKVMLAAEKEFSDSLIWMPLHIFLIIFDRLIICRFFSFKDFSRLTVEGCWTGEVNVDHNAREKEPVVANAGGGPHWCATWDLNPHYRLVLDEPSTVFVSLSLPQELSPYCFRKNAFYSEEGVCAAHGFHITSSPYFPLILGGDVVVLAESGYTVDGDATCSVFLKAGSYWIIPSLIRANVNSRYFLQIISSSKAVLVCTDPSTDWVCAPQLLSEMSHCGHYRYCESNSQYELLISIPSSAVLGVKPNSLNMRLVVKMEVVSTPQESHLCIYLLNPSPSFRGTRSFPLRSTGFIEDGELLVSSPEVVGDFVVLDTEREISLTDSGNGFLGCRLLIVTNTLPSGRRVRIRTRCFLQSEAALHRALKLLKFEVKELPFWPARLLRTRIQRSAAYGFTSRDASPVLFHPFEAVPLFIVEVEVFKPSNTDGLAVSVLVCRSGSLRDGLLLAPTPSTEISIPENIIIARAVLTKGSYISLECRLDPREEIEDEYLIIPILFPRGILADCEIKVSSMSNGFDLLPLS